MKLVERAKASPNEIDPPTISFHLELTESIKADSRSIERENLGYSFNKTNFLGDKIDFKRGRRSAGTASMVNYIILSHILTEAFGIHRCTFPLLAQTKRKRDL